MLSLVVKIRVSVEPASTASYIAGFVLISAYIWYKRHQRSSHGF